MLLGVCILRGPLGATTKLGATPFLATSCAPPCLSPTGVGLPMPSTSLTYRRPAFTGRRARTY